MNDYHSSVAPTSVGHRRRNPLTGDWVLVSPHRLDRPWQGARGAQPVGNRLSYAADCYLCPGNERANGQRNPNYRGVHAFDNDYPALQAEAPPQPLTASALFDWAPEQGVCRVLCFSPHHWHTLSELTDAEVTAVVDLWSEQSAELGARFPHGSVQIFENKGQMMGCSNPHPHAQVWAQESVPTLLHRELHACEAYFDTHSAAMLIDYVVAELNFAERIVCANEHFVALVPYWATWPFETLVLPRRPVARLPQLTPDERVSLAAVLRRLSMRYDNLFGVSFPYSAGLHQVPAVGTWDTSFTLHMHFYPPLLRSAEVRKFMVGYEMLAEAQRDLSPEAAAALLRAQPEVALGS